MKINSNIQKILIATAFTLALACASKIKPVNLTKDANPKTELEIYKSDRQKSLGQQADMLSPENFKKSDKYYNEAIEQTKNDESREEILESISYAKAYLAAADKIVIKTEVQNKDITEARQSAIDSGAQQSSDEFEKADKNFVKYTKKIETGKNIEPKTSAEIQQDYINLEIAAIKTKKLSEAKNYLALAKKQDAEKKAPRSYSLAQQQYNSAESLIESDRSNTEEIDQASIVATSAAQRVLTLLKNIETMKNTSPEQNAMNKEYQDLSVIKADELTTLAIQNSMNKDQRIRSQSSQIANQKSQNSQLKNQESFNASFKNARAQFNSKEADVYRQGDNLIIRLKSMEFASGRSDLPAASLMTLNKVKDVIAETNSNKVVIEGHTDTTGSAPLNMTLSKKRAQSVAEFLISSQSVDASEIESVGYGYEKPISTNKTNQGRAQNRRVDIVITPDTMNQ